MMGDGLLVSLLVLSKANVLRGGARGRCLFEAGRLLTFPTFKLGAYSRLVSLRVFWAKRHHT